MENPSDEELLRVYQAYRTIAVVGASTSPDKAAHFVPEYLKDQGFEVVPVNPGADEVLGEQAHASLEEIDGSIDVVVVFRSSEEAPDIARQAVDAGAKVIWLQEGIVSQEAASIARDTGLTVVMDRCIGRTHGQLGLGPGPD
ncbi:MAG: CoA-binding protein [Nitriliruptorales bacterium]